MVHIWKNTYNESMGKYFAHTLKNLHHIDIFNMLWGSFRLTYIVESSFFECIRVGDDKYTLSVHKEKDGVIKVIFVIR